VSFWSIFQPPPQADAWDARGNVTLEYVNMHLYPELALCPARAERGVHYELEDFPLK